MPCLLPSHRWPHRWPHRLAGLGLAALLLACQAQTPPSSVARTGPAAEAALLQRIEAEIGQAECSSTAECRSLPIGAKACGGPARWIAWSTRHSRAEQLQAWAAELARRQRQREEAHGLVSTCSIVPDPGASCDAGRCVLARADPSR